MNLLLFSPRQYENLLYSLEWENFLPAFALVFALGCNLRAKSFRTKTLVNALLARLSTYTFANGMLVWLLVFPVQWKGTDNFESAARRRTWRIAYSLATLVSIGLYFFDYHHPADTPPFAIGLWTILHYLLIWLGSLFITPAPTLTGGFILSVFVGLTVVAIHWARRIDSWRAFYPWLILGSYVLISGLVTASGRIGFGLSSAPSVRYTVFTVFFYIAVIGLFCNIYENVRRSISTKCVAIEELPLLEQGTAAREHLRMVMR